MTEQQARALVKAARQRMFNLGCAIFGGAILAAIVALLWLPAWPALGVYALCGASCFAPWRLRVRIDILRGGRRVVRLLEPQLKSEAAMVADVLAIAAMPEEAKAGERAPAPPAQAPSVSFIADVPYCTGCGIRFDAVMPWWRCDRCPRAAVDYGVVPWWKEVAADAQEPAATADAATEQEPTCPTCAGSHIVLHRRTDGEWQHVACPNCTIQPPAEDADAQPVESIRADRDDPPPTAGIQWG